MNALLLLILLQWGGSFCAPVGVLMQVEQPRHLLTIKTDDPAMTLLLDGKTIAAKGEVRHLDLSGIPSGRWKYKASCIWKDGRQTFHDIGVEGGKSIEVVLNDPGKAKPKEVVREIPMLGADTVPPAFPLPPTGVNWDEIENRREKVVLHASGREPVELSREMAGHLIENGLTDDSHKWFLTFISSDESARKAFLADVAVAPLLLHARDNYHVHAYRPDDPMLAGLNYPLGVLLQDTKGKELAHLSSYGGTDALVSSLRKADPNYKPGGSQPALPVNLPGLNTDLMAAVAAVFIVIMVVAGGIFWQRRGAQ